MPTSTRSGSLRRQLVALSLACGLQAGLGTTVFAADPPAPAEAPAPTLVPRAAEPVTIDGLLDEPVWKAAPSAYVQWQHGKTGVKSETPQAKVWFAWDERYFYIAYETFDENLVAIPGPDIQGPMNNKRQGALIWSPGSTPIDVVEFFISTGSPKHFWEIHQNALNNFNDVAVTLIDKSDPISDTDRGRYGILFGHEEYIQDEPPFTFASAVAPKPKADGKPSSVNDSRDKDTGYTAEIRLPWNGINAPLKRRTPDPERTGKAMPWLMSGAVLKIIAVTQNGDLANRYYHSSETFPGGWFHHGYAYYPEYKLVDDAPVAAAPDAPATTPAPATP